MTIGSDVGPSTMPNSYAPKCPDADDYIPGSGEDGHIFQFNENVGDGINSDNDDDNGEGE